MRFGSFVLDSEGRQVTHDSRGGVHLTPKAFDLLVLLIDAAPRVVRKAELHKRLWVDSFVSDATLVSLVKELRRELDDHDASSPLIRTAHGVGYAFAGNLKRVVSTQPSTTIRWVVAGARRIQLSDGENLIGRDPGSIVWLDMSGVSRRHARIIVAGHEAVLEDLQSKNGTTVNDKPTEGRQKLRDGDRIHVGPIVVVYHASASGMSTETLIDRTQQT